FRHHRHTVAVGGLVEQRIDVVGVEVEHAFQAHQVAVKIFQGHTEVSAVVGGQQGIGAAVLDADHGQLGHGRAEAQGAVGHGVVAVISGGAFGIERTAHADEDS